MERDKLEELEQELYGKEEKAEQDVLRRSRRGVFPEEPHRAVPESWVGRGLPRDVRPRVTMRGLIKFSAWLVTVIVVVVGVTVAFLYFGRRGEELELTVGGRENIEAGELVTVPVILRNTGRVPLKEVEVSVVFPPHAMWREGSAERPAPPKFIQKIDAINPDEEKKFEFVLRFFGHEGEALAVSASVLYRPENLRARFTVNSSRLFSIQHVPLAISWEVSDVVTQDQETEIKLHYTSNARAPVENLLLRVEYPASFVFATADPSPGESSNQWSIGTLYPDKGGEITIRGMLAGEEGEVKAFRASLGILATSTHDWISFSESSQEIRIGADPLSLRSYLGDARDAVIAPGQRISFSVHYRNNTPFTLKNVTVRTVLSEMFIAPPNSAQEITGSRQRFLEFPSLNIERQGVFDGISRSLVWGPGALEDLRALEPGEEGRLNFTIDTKSRPLLLNSQEKNLAVGVKTTIEVAEVPEGLAGIKVNNEDTVRFKVRTNVLFAGRTVFRTSPIVNSGPIPPRVGSRTSYTFLWELKNFTSDLSGAEIRTFLPPNVKWENTISPKDAAITYNEASGEVRWRIGVVKAGAGIVTPSLVGAAQVSIIPSEVDLGKTMTLSGESNFSATDAFTGAAVTAMVGGFSTDLRGDPAHPQQSGVVVR